MPGFVRLPRRALAPFRGLRPAPIGGGGDTTIINGGASELELSQGEVLEAGLTGYTEIGPVTNPTAGDITLGPIDKTALEAQGLAVGAASEDTVARQTANNAATDATNALGTANTALTNANSAGTLASQANGAASTAQGRLNDLTLTSGTNFSPGQVRRLPGVGDFRNPEGTTKQAQSPITKAGLVAQGFEFIGDEVELALSIAKKKRVLSSVSAMMAASYVDQERIWLDGYYAPGDSFSDWEMRYHETGRAGITVDGGFYITGSGADDYFTAIDQRTAYVTRFGCRPDTTGTVDSTAEFQLAVGTAGRNVFLDTWITHTFNDLANNVHLFSYGDERGGMRQLAGQRLTNVGGAFVLVRGLTVKSGIDFAQISNMHYDGNALAYLDYTGADAQAGDLESGVNAEGAFEVGRLKASNIFTGPLSRDPYVKPKRFHIENVYSYNAIRNCYLFPGTSDPGGSVVTFKNLRAADALSDHWLYSENTELSGDGLYCSGYARHGGVVMSGGEIKNFVVSGVTVNPHTIPSSGEKFEMHELIHDRADYDYPSVVDGIRTYGSLEPLSAVVDGRRIIRSESENSLYSKLVCDFRATSDYNVALIQTSGTEDAPGNQRGQTLDGFKVTNAPGGLRIHFHDPEKHDATLIDFTVKSGLVQFRENAAVTNDAVIRLHGDKVLGYTLKDVVITSKDFGEAGMSSLMWFDTVSTTKNVTIENVSHDCADNIRDALRVTTGGPKNYSGVTVYNLRTNNKAPSNNSLSRVDSYRSCTFTNGVFADHGNVLSDYADDAAAGAAGLVAGQDYHTAGVRMVKL